MIRRGRCWSIWECRLEHRKFRVSGFEFREKGLHGYYRKTSKGRKEAQVLFAQAQPLQDLRTSARFPAQVRHLPALLPRAGVAGRDSWSFEVVLVRQSSVVSLRSSARMDEVRAHD